MHLEASQGYIVIPCLKQKGFRETHRPTGGATERMPRVFEKA